MINAMINGVLCQVDESTLTPNHHVDENDNERAEVTEWLKDGVIVHRSVNIFLKKGLGIEGALGQLGG
jgi:hypothetical protein